MKFLNNILKNMGYILIIPAYILFFTVFFAYLAYFCFQILTGHILSGIVYNFLKTAGLIVDNNISINIISAIIISSILMMCVFTDSYMIEILKKAEIKTVDVLSKVKFNCSFAILILLNCLAMYIRNSYKEVPLALPNGNLIPLGIFIWLSILLITYLSNKNIKEEE
ncbi:hypothetical protein MOO46_06320 [Apilactobacillus apisilvae]|uniref:Integral membrane protein n=1 Tax=Apilactobacillus apisilvae TaxID=2923364 RepID=A0ABY4PHH5_9LACO|nr:hypothetical protein [Apilactobacillus apisilvae]UQS84852.1 hypothetical protein MOO46_06320 [Apilactobacillus apisilvae]